MTQPIQQVRCRCGEVMTLGYTTVMELWGGNLPLENPRLAFVVPGEPTSMNPITALKQGLREAPADEAYLLRGHRCPACGIVELIASDRIPWTP